MFSSLKVRDYRIYWFGMFLSLIGTWLQTVAQSWLVFQLTQSAFLLGLVGFLSSIPVLLFSLLGGVLADRLSKRNILIVTQTLFMFLAFLLGALTQFKLITANQIMLIAFLNGVVMAFDAPSRQAMVVELVGRAHLPNAIALNSVSFNSSRIIGPALAGILVASIGMSGCFYLNGASFLAVILALFLIKINLGRKQDKGKSAWRDLKEGLIFVVNHKLIFSLICLVGVMSLFGVAYMILMPVFANDVLGVGVKGLAVLMASSGFGALLGALLLARLGDFKAKGRFIFWDIQIFCFSLILFSISKSYPLSVIALIFTGGSSVSAIALVNTLLQTKVADEFRGRVMSVFMLTFAGILPFGNLIAGSIAQALGAQAAVLISSLICLALFFMVNIFYPGIRDI